MNEKMSASLEKPLDPRSGLGGLGSGGEGKMEALGKAIGGIGALFKEPAGCAACQKTVGSRCAGDGVEGGKPVLEVGLVLQCDEGGVDRNEVDEEILGGLIIEGVAGGRKLDGEPGDNAIKNGLDVVEGGVAYVAVTGKLDKGRNGLGPGKSGDCPVFYRR